MFKFKGISSKQMQVVIEEEEHFLAKAAQRYDTTEIEGRFKNNKANRSRIS